MDADSYKRSNSRADLSLRKAGITHPLLPGKALLLIVLTLIVASMAKSGLLVLAPVQKQAHESQVLEILSHHPDVLLLQDLLHLKPEHHSSQNQFEAKLIFPRGFLPARAAWAVSAAPVALAGKNKKSRGVWKQQLSPLTTHQREDKCCQSPGRCFKMKPIPVLVPEWGSEGTRGVACCGRAGQVAVTKSRCNSSIPGSEGRGLGTSLPLDQRRRSSLQVKSPSLLSHSFSPGPSPSSLSRPGSCFCQRWVPLTSALPASANAIFVPFLPCKTGKKIKAEFAKVRQEKNVQLKTQYKQG